MNDKVRFRTCVGCRDIKHQSEMIRVCCVNKETEIDYNNKLGGRGAYICSTDCLKKIKQKNALNRVLKTNVPIEIYTKLEELLNCDE